MFVCQLTFYMHRRKPEMETVDLFQSHVSLNLFQFQDDCLFYMNSSTATKNILISTWYCNNVYKSKTLVFDVTLDLHE